LNFFEIPPIKQVLGSLVQERDCEAAGRVPPRHGKQPTGRRNVLLSFLSLSPRGPTWLEATGRLTWRGAGLTHHKSSTIISPYCSLVQPYWYTVHTVHHRSVSVLLHWFFSLYQGWFSLKKFAKRHCSSFRCYLTNIIQLWSN
jgi:hypothetical protein